MERACFLNTWSGSGPPERSPRRLKDHAATVKAHVLARGGAEEAAASVDALVELNGRRAALQKERDAALATRKKLSAAIGKAMKAGGEDVDALKHEVSAAAATAEAAEASMAEVEAEAGAALAALPNLLDEATPDGRDEADNVILRERGRRAGNLRRNFGRRGRGDAPRRGDSVETGRGATAAATRRFRGDK